MPVSFRNAVLTWLGWLLLFIQSISNPVLPDAGYHSFDIPGSVSEGIIPAAETGKIHGRRTIQRHVIQAGYGQHQRNPAGELRSKQGNL